MNKLILKMVKPFIKNYIKKYIKEIANEEYQTIFVEKFLEKIDLPEFTRDQKKKFLDQVYNVTQELLIEYVDAL